MLPWRQHSGGEGCYHGDCAFGHCAPHVWNDLPLSNIESCDTDTFKSLLKTHCFKLAYRVLLIVQRFEQLLEKCYIKTMILLLWKHHSGEEGCYHGYSTVGDRVVTMERVQWNRGALPWSRKTIILAMFLNTEQIKCTE